MAILPVTLALVVTGAVALVNAERAGRARLALRRIVEAQALAAWANTGADHATYERLACDRDEAIDEAAAIVGGDR